MRLQAKVTAIESAAEYADNKQRVRIRIGGDNTAYGEFRVPNDENLVLDQQVVLNIEIMKTQPAKA